MNYSQIAKNEILKLKFGADCCKTAFLSAVIHSTGSVVIRDKTLAVEIMSENEELLEKTASIIRDFYGFEATKSGSRKSVLSGRRNDSHARRRNFSARRRSHGGGRGHFAFFGAKRLLCR